MIAQGGIFRTPKIAQQVLADALNTPITVMATAGEGGPWGMAVLAAYTRDRAGAANLADYLDAQVFKTAESTTLAPAAAGVAGFDRYIAQYQNGLAAEQRPAAPSPTTRHDRAGVLPLGHRLRQWGGTAGTASAPR